MECWDLLGDNICHSNTNEEDAAADQGCGYYGRIYFKFTLALTLVVVTLIRTWSDKAPWMNICDLILLATMEYVLILRFFPLYGAISCDIPEIAVYFGYTVVYATMITGATFLAITIW